MNSVFINETLTQVAKKKGYGTALVLYIVLAIGIPAATYYLKRQSDITVIKARKKFR